MKKIIRNTVMAMTVMITVILSLSFIVKADDEYTNHFNGEYYGDSEEHLQQMEEDLKAAGYECFTVGYSYNEEWSANEDFQLLSLCTSTKTRVYCIPSEVEAFINGGGNEAKMTLLYNTYYVSYAEFWYSEDEIVTVVIQADISNAFKEAHPDAEITVTLVYANETLILSPENEYAFSWKEPLLENMFGSHVSIKSVKITDGLESEYNIDYPDRTDYYYEDVAGGTVTIVIAIDGGDPNSSKADESGDTASAGTEPSDTEPSDAEPAGTEPSDTRTDVASSAASVEDVPTEESQSHVLFIVIAVAALGVIIAGVVIVKKKD